MNNVKLTEKIVEVVEKIIYNETVFEVTTELKDSLFDGIYKIINEQVN